MTCRGAKCPTRSGSHCLNETSTSLLSDDPKWSLYCDEAVTAALQDMSVPNLDQDVEGARAELQPRGTQALVQRATQRPLQNQRRHRVNVQSCSQCH